MAEPNRANNGVTQEEWDAWWLQVVLPARASAGSRPHRNRLVKQLLPRGPDVRFLECGCAPGGNLVLYHELLECEVWGVEWSEAGYLKTLENMRLTQTPAQVCQGDFFTCPFEGGFFHVVFSMGFVEHFADRESVLARMDHLTAPGGWIVATWPNLFGVNGWIFRHFDCGSRGKHYFFRAREVADMLQERDYEIAYAGPMDGPGLMTPFTPRGGLKRFPRLRRLANAPLGLFNRLSRGLNRRMEGGLWESDTFSIDQGVFARKPEARVGPSGAAISYL